MKRFFKILAFETSCDDTSVAVIDQDYNVLSNIISSQPDHNAFGGVLPELASRLHLKNIVPVTNAALNKASVTFNDIDAIAVSVNPGLIGSLLVGLSFAKSIAYSLNKPLIAVNHMLGHISANRLENPALLPPYLALVVSGGHTELVWFKTATEFYIVGKTKDDAAGEAFDKIAKILGLGYPGGPIIDKIAKDGNPSFVEFPRAMNRKDNYDFSFSGFKTAIMQYLQSQSTEFIKEHLSDIVASAQEAIVEILVKKTLNFAKREKIQTIIIAGGVSANSRLRECIQSKAKKQGISVYIPSIKYCTDNAAMIGAAAIEKFEKGEFSDLSLNAFSTKGIRYL